MLIGGPGATWAARLALAAGLVAAPAGAWAQTSLTLEEAMKRARVATAEARAREAAVGEAGARIRQARSGFLPRIDVSETVERGNQPVFVFSSLLMGFRFWKPLIWDKVTMGMGYHYRARYEMILFFEKGKRKLNDLGVPDVLEARRIHRGYPTEKPVEISEILVRQSSRAGELVIDPFMGSGSVGVAAVGTMRSFAGCDIAVEAVEVTRRRLLEAGAKEEAMLAPVEQATRAVQLSLADARGRADASRKRPSGDTEGPTRCPIVPEVAE